MFPCVSVRCCRPFVVAGARRARAETTHAGAAKTRCRNEHELSTAPAVQDVAHTDGGARLPGFLAHLAEGDGPSPAHPPAKRRNCWRAAAGDARQLCAAQRDHQAQISQLSTQPERNCRSAAEQAEAVCVGLGRRVLCADFQRVALLREARARTAFHTGAADQRHEGLVRGVRQA